MAKHISYQIDWATTLQKEIDSDDSSWFEPLGSGIGIFDQGRMRFVNRNLNYFYFKNMLSFAVKNNYEYNPHYPNVLKFCQETGILTNETGPFGRMCVWKIIPGGCLLPHVDDFQYHKQIRRYIFCISNHHDDQVTIKIDGIQISVSQGLLFQFNPAKETHEFINHTNRDWYFLGFDFWDINRLKAQSYVQKVNDNTEIEYISEVGPPNEKVMYMSNH
jgi:hypothetical protein